MKGRSKQNLIDSVIPTHPTPPHLPHWQPQNPMRLFRTLSVALLLAGCASGSGQAQNDQPTHETTNREWPVSAHYDGKRFYNTQGSEITHGVLGLTVGEVRWVG